MTNVIAHPTLIQAANDLQAETIAEQQKEIVKLRGELATEKNRVAKRDKTIADMQVLTATTLINAALKRPDVLAAFRHPRNVVVSVRKEDDPKAPAIGDYALADSDLEAAIEDKQFFSLLSWFVSVALGQEVVMEEGE